MWNTKPSYLASTQVEISTEVPDEQDGVTAYASVEQTAWQLSKTSVLPLGAGVIATKSGIGRWLLAFPGSYLGRSYEWNLNGPLDGFGVDTTPLASLPSDGGNAVFDGTYLCDTNSTIASVELTQRVPGSAGTTSIEVIRRRAGVFASIATLSNVSTAAFAAVVSTPIVSDLNILDILFCRLRSVQTGSPGDITARVRFVP